MNLMKTYHILFPIALALCVQACDDQKMEWGSPDGQYAVTSAEIPLAVKEVLANYEPIKTYAVQYAPQTIIGIGAGASLYAEGGSMKNVVDENYQMFTPGNAMKHDAVVTSSGAMDFTTVDTLLSSLPSDMKLYGHNFIWYQQQQQSYLKSLIAPTLVVETTSDIATILAGDAANFDGGTTGGWGYWGSNMESVEVVSGVGTDGTAAAVLTNSGDGSFWQAQFAYTFDTPLDSSQTYTIRFKAKSTTSSGQIQFQYQNGSTYGSQSGYNTFDVGTDWTTCEYSFKPAYDDVNRIILNFGKVDGSYTVDDIEFGIMVEDPMENVLAGDSYDFEGGTMGGWNSWGSNKESAEVVSGEGYQSSVGLVLKSASDANFWEAQCAYDLDDAMQQDKKYVIQFYAKSASGAGQLQFQYQNSSTYGSQGGYQTFELTSDWTKYEYEFTPAYDDANQIIFNFGKVGDTYYIDNVKFGIATDQSSSAKSFVIRRVGRRKASSSYYVLKSAEEKREALLGAMEAWVKGMAEHLDEKGIVPYGYDVINEPITDGTYLIRGVDDGAFGGSTTDDDGNVTYDTEPTETTTDGLTLNWGDHRFYWGYYVKDYAVKVFQYARQYLPAETKLFVNDYNLENSPSKLSALINFVNGIDEANGSEIVDGIGTQMHISFSATDDTTSNAELLADLKEKVDTCFQTLAATGKLIRVTELDVALGTSSPSSAQYEAQNDVYKMIIRSYLDNIPTAQQSGVTVWGVSDNESEHEYWLNGDAPCLFDASYLRKWAYKGFCDGIANEDLGLQYGGDDYKAYYENSNVSSTVDE